MNPLAMHRSARVQLTRGGSAHVPQPDNSDRTQCGRRIPPGATKIPALVKHDTCVACRNKYRPASAPLQVRKKGHPGKRPRFGILPRRKNGSKRRRVLRPSYIDRLGVAPGWVRPWGGSR